MIHTLNEYDKLKVIRPVLGDHILDSEKLPIMHKITEQDLKISTAIPLNIRNLCTKYDNSDKIVISFTYDKYLLKYWNDPMKYIPVLKTARAVGTPDYSAYVKMNPNEIRHNVYKNRWLGCLWQDYGINALPTISWALPDTYDVCFGGVEKGGIVIISTLGCADHADTFLKGFNEMKRRLKPSLIIVYGDMLSEMYGRFVQYPYLKAFNSNKQAYRQLSFLEPTTIFERKEGKK